MITLIGEPSTELLERQGELDALAALLDDVRNQRRGWLVLVAGEAGVGKTALLRRFCDEHRSPGSDPLGCLRCAVHAESAGAADRGRGVERGRGGGARPRRSEALRGRHRPHARAWPACAERARARRCSLGRRSDPRRGSPARAQGGRCSRARPRELPRRARSGASAAGPGGRALDQPGGEAAAGRSALAGGRRPTRRTAWRRRRCSLPKDGREPVLRHGGPGGGRRRDPEHGPGRGPRPGGAFEPRGAGPARGRRRRPASRRDPGSWRRSRRRPSIASRSASPPGC